MIEPQLFKVPRYNIADADFAARTRYAFDVNDVSLVYGSIEAALTRPVTANLIPHGSDTIERPKAVILPGDEVMNLSVAVARLGNERVRQGYDKAFWAGCLMIDALKGGRRAEDARQLDRGIRLRALVGLSVKRERLIAALEPAIDEAAGSLAERYPILRTFATI
jgi:hypothetical protein